MGTDEKKTRSSDPDDYLKKVQELVRSIRYATVSIIIQDGRVVQVDKTEKFRL